MRYLTVAEYASQENISVNSVYRRIKKNQVKSTKEVRNNQEIILVIVEDDIKPSVNSDKPFLLHNDNEINPDKPSENSELVKLLIEMHKQNSELVANLQHYAQLAGQTQLLTDSESRTKKEYFELYQENKQLSISLEKIKFLLQIKEDQEDTLKNEIQSLKKQIESLEILKETNDKELIEENENIKITLHKLEQELLESQKRLEQKDKLLKNLQEEREEDSITYDKKIKSLQSKLKAVDHDVLERFKYDNEVQKKEIKELSDLVNDLSYENRRVQDFKFEATQARKAMIEAEGNFDSQIKLLEKREAEIKLLNETVENLKQELEEYKNKESKGFLGKFFK